ncbi:hypothetical protein HYQ46_010901 [Verticillium longisporum]|nr:hypothetical protein HYQ46_010901 [Verticillium longisporum]
MTRSGYMNNLAALDVLERLWAGDWKEGLEARSPGAARVEAMRRGPFNWTRCIGGPGVEVEWIIGTLTDWDKGRAWEVRLEWEGSGNIIMSEAEDGLQWRDFSSSCLINCTEYAGARRRTGREARTSRDDGNDGDD